MLAASTEILLKAKNFFLINVEDNHRKYFLTNNQDKETLITLFNKLSSASQENPDSCKDACLTLIDEYFQQIQLKNQILINNVEDL